LEFSNIPEISRFLGIVIYIYYREHSPPHFHAIYGEYEITVEIETGIVNGRFPRRAMNAVLEWTAINEKALMENWDLAQTKQGLKKIKPLE
jgi:Domain of unknown function (DUF4160)